MNKQEKYKFKFSIVITNSIQENIDESAIKSLISQTIGFKKNIQVIFIGLINIEIEKYSKEYPNNIKIINSNSIYKSKIKNESLKYCEGKYVNFISCKNSFSKKTLKEVYNFFENNNDVIDIVSIPAYSYERKKINNRYINFKKENYIVNLEIEPQNFIISNQVSFYKYEILNTIGFNEMLEFNDDVDMNFRLYSMNKKFGYVYENVKFIYKESSGLEENNILNKLANSIQVIQTIEGDKQEYIKEYILYESLNKLKKIKREFFEEQEDYNEIVNEYKKYIKNIDYEFIFLKSKIVNEINKKYFIIKSLEEETSLYINNSGNIIFNNYCIGNFNEIHFKIKKIKKENNFLLIDIMYNDYDISNINLKFFDVNNNEYENYYNEKTTSSYDIKYGEFKINEIRLIKFRIPVFESTFSLNIINNEKINFHVSNFSMLSFLKYSLNDKKIKCFDNNYSISFNNNIVIKSERNYNIIYKIKTFLYIAYKYKYFAFSRLLNKKNKKYILLNDRPKKAGDNGEAMFKYINENEKKLAKNTYFILAKKNKDYKRLKKIGKIVIQNSLKHKYLFINSKLITSSHAAKQFYTPFRMENLKYYTDLLNYKFVWLQHGVIHNNVSKSVNKYNANIDYFIISNYGERNEIESDRYFYDKNDILLTGLPRFDYLESETKNIISLVPTWRRTLSGRILSCGFHEIKDSFDESQYYKEYSKLLQSDDLYNLIEKNNFILNFNIHPGMAGYEDYFKKFQNDRIKIISAYDVDYKKMFRESNLLITDYSSVAFDFSYLKKPLIYFQFDRDEFYKHQYEIGYFDYSKDGFGEVIENSDKIIEKIEYYFQNDFKVEDNYLNNINNSFTYKDKNNCKRIISKLKEEKVI